MRIDAYTHFFPRKFFDKMLEVAGQYKDMGKRVRAIPTLHDLDARKKIIDSHKDYAQILAYPQPPIENFAKSPQEIDEFIRIINDGFAELCAKERDHFPGWIAQISLDAPDAGVAEAERAINQLGALGVQIYTNVAGKPIDRPQYLPFWKKMNDLGKPIWLHPARGASHWSSTCGGWKPWKRQRGGWSSLKTSNAALPIVAASSIPARREGTSSPASPSGSLRGGRPS